MVESERQEVLQELSSGRDALRACMTGVGNRLAIRKPGPGRWSILECVEHVAVAEQFLLSRLTGARRSDCSHRKSTREAMIVARGLDRAKPAESPEAGRPKGRFQTLDEAVSFFECMRAQTIRFVEEFNEDPRIWLTDHPLIPGPVNCYEMFLIMSTHPVRHAEQIAEIRTALASSDGQD